MLEHGQPPGDVQRPARRHGGARRAGCIATLSSLALGLALPAAALSPATEVGWRLDASGAAQAQALTLVTEVPAADRGLSAHHYVAADVRGLWYCHDGAAWAACGAALPAYAHGALPARLSLALGTVDTTALRGARLWAGYGSSADEMLASGRYRQVSTLGPAGALVWDNATASVPTAGAAYLAFNNTAVALRDATGALHLVWDDAGRGYHGRHDGTAWRVQALPVASQGRVSKVSMAALPDGELIAAWSEDDHDQRNVVVARTQNGRAAWGQALVLASGRFDAPVALQALERADASPGAVVAWMDEGQARLQARSWRGTAWSATDWTPATSPASAAAVPHDVALAARGTQVWAVWEDKRAGSASEIYLARSDDGGEHWQSDQRLSLASGSPGGGDPSASVLADGTLLLAWQSQNRALVARATEAGANRFAAPVALGSGLFPHVAAHPRGQVAFSWEHFSAGQAFDDSSKSVGNSVGLDGLAALVGPHAMPGSADTLYAVQAAVCTSHDRIDVFWVDVSIAGQRQLKWRSGRYTD